MNALEELTEFEDQIDLTHVERRLRDWEARLTSLYACISSWLPDGWTSAVNGKVRLYEPLMEKFGVPELYLPQLSLCQSGIPSAKLEPRYLWIIGSNGRVDLIGSTGHFVINDRSDIFAEPSWHIAAFLARLDEVVLTADSFHRALQ